MRNLSRLLLSATLLCLISTQALAAPLIRDAEIEDTLRQYGDPIFKAAGLKPSAVKLFIVQDDSLNAFVAGGANMFIHTGIIMASPTPDMLIGVMAHETGHIAGGHLAKGSEKLRNAQLGSILSYVLGAAAAVATGKPEAGAAVITGGGSMLGRNFLAFTRTHENAADQAALSYLDKLNISASGMIKMFELLRRNERQRMGARDPYTLTHPLSTERIDTVRSHVQQSPIPDGQYPKQFDLLQQRMVAKLYGFIQSPERTLMQYPQSNKSVAGRMARAIAYYKMPDLTRSLAEMDSLLAESPNDAFFHELKGQILFENRRPAEALESYSKANQLRPNSPLILTDLAKIEIEQGDAKSLASAVAHLERATILDNSNAGSWHLLATAYGKSGNLPMSSLALAEKYLLLGDSKAALGQATEAIDGLPSGTPAARRAQDLKARALDMRQEDRDKN